ncbi:MAG TPA: hypothetical protein VFC47_11290 [Caulobacteraceae bacterium]|nr:hypothetical protein [Caulobacteraceae bacterium]
MVQTALDVCNLALGRIGGVQIDAIDETTPAGAYCIVEYPQCRDWLIGKYRWSFAVGVAQLSPLAVTPPDCPRTHAYNPPADIVGAIFDYRTAAQKNAASSLNTEMANGLICCDSPLMFVEYTRRVPENTWPSWFVELARIVFASGLASSVAQNQGLAAALWQTAFGSPQEGLEGGLYGQARNEDSRNAPRREAFAWWDDGALVNARYGWGWLGPGRLEIPFVALPGNWGPPSFINFPDGG